VKRITNEYVDYGRRALMASFDSYVPTELVLQKIGLRPPVDVEPRAAS
jgi:hypothetical protein